MKPHVILDPEQKLGILIRRLQIGTYIVITIVGNNLNIYSNIVSIFIQYL